MLPLLSSDFVTIRYNKPLGGDYAYFHSNPLIVTPARKVKRDVVNTAAFTLCATAWEKFRCARCESLVVVWYVIPEQRCN